MWYTWASIEAFETWHHSACEHLGLPKASTNAETGAVDEKAQWTTTYTAPVLIAPNDVRAFVGSDIAGGVSDGIGAPCEQPVTTKPD